MSRRLLASQSGLTVIEILIASVIFMIGFSTLIMLMNSSLVRFSARELLQADQVAQELMSRAVADRDKTSMDTIVTRSRVAFRVERRVVVAERLAGVSLTVYRERQNRKIVELYDAFVVRSR
jgi:Tfp pilus assembly protein PilV